LALAVAPDGTYAYVSDRSSVVLRIDLATGVARRIEASDVGTIEFTPDPSRLVTAKRDGALIERDALTLQPTGRQFLTSQGEDGDHSVTFSEDGRLMSTLSGTNIQLWDWPSGTRIGDAFPSDEGWGVSARGLWAIGGVSGRPIRWNIDVGSWPAIACRAASRNLTPDEWQQYGPKGSSYEATCPQYPLVDPDDRRS
jgi:hypothetical protein